MFKYMKPPQIEYWIAALDRTKARSSMNTG